MGITYTEGVLTGPTGNGALPGRQRSDLHAGAARCLEGARSGAQTHSYLHAGRWHPRAESCLRVPSETSRRRWPYPVILGEPDDEALRGAVTLEILGFVLHPFKRTLEPMRMLLA